MDTLDLRIIDPLHRDGRTANAQIGRTMWASKPTVRRWLQLVVRNDVVGVVAIPHPEKAGFASNALVGLQTDLDKVNEVADVLCQLEEVYYVSVTIGSSDVFVRVAVESTEALHDLPSRRIRPMAGVNRTVSFVNLAIKKRSGRLA